MVDGAALLDESTQWTQDGRLRRPSFKGLRRDKDPTDVVRAEPV